MDYEQTGMLLNQRITDDPNSKPKLMGQTCRLWRDLIETYSRNFLTNSQDKLIASSGIANCMRQITRGEYVASLWQGGGGVSVARPPLACAASRGMWSGAHQAQYWALWQRSHHGLIVNEALLD